MDYLRIKEIIEENSDIIDFGEFGQGGSDEWIGKAEERLGIKFPPSYVWWLKNYSGGEINGEEIFSIYEIDFDSVVGGDIVYINELNYKNGDSDTNKLTIQENDQGESYYFDLTSVDTNGESPVFCNENKYSNNFLEFLIKKIGE